MAVIGRVPGVYLVAQTDRSGDKGVFHAVVMDEQTSKYTPVCRAQFSARPTLTKSAGRMVTRRPCTRCYGPACKTIVVLREDRDALQEKEQDQP